MQALQLRDDSTDVHAEGFVGLAASPCVAPRPAMGGIAHLAGRRWVLCGSPRIHPRAATQPTWAQRAALLQEQLGRLGLEGKRGPVRRTPCPAKNMVDSSTGAVRARPGMAFPAGSAGHLVKPDRSFRLDASDQDSRFGSKLRCASAVKYAQGLLTRDDKFSHPELLGVECFLR